MAAGGRVVNVKTAVPFQLDRTLNPKVAMQFAQTLEFCRAIKNA
jgi:hypothetical protein